MQKVLFIDRDGTIIREPDDFQVDLLEKLRFLPGVITNLAKVARETDFVIVMVTNQDGLGTESFPETAFHPAQNFVIQTLADEGIEFADVFVDRTFPHENAPTRKPGTAMLTKYLTGEYDLANSYVIGDRPTDVELARNLGSKAIYIRNPSFPLEGDDAQPRVELAQQRAERRAHDARADQDDVTLAGCHRQRSTGEGLVDARRPRAR